MASNIQVSSTVTLNKAKLEKLTKTQATSLAQTADALLTDLRDEQLMPFDTGNLQNDSTSVDDSQKEKNRVSIVSTTPYARRLYFHPEYNYQRTHNRAAGGRWLRYWLPGGTRQNFCSDTFAKIYRRLTKL